MASQLKLRKIARRAARMYGVDPNVFERQINMESGFRTHATSSAGARGIAQFMPGTARSEGVDPNNPRQALKGAARLDAKLIKQLGYRKGLAAYNAGPGNIGAGLGYADSILSGRSPKGRPDPGGGGRSTTTKTTISTPGVDNSDVRRQLVAQYLSGNHSSPVGGDPLTALKRSNNAGVNLTGLISSLRQSQDVPGQSVTTRSKSDGGSRGGVHKAATGGAIHRKHLGRVDQGVDFTGSGPVPSPADGVVTKSGAMPGWPGGRGVVIKLDHPPDPRHKYVYLAENVRPTVKAGQRVRKGQKIAHALGSSPFLEYGWAADASGTTLARARGHADLHPNHSNTPEGRSFKRWLGL